MLNGTPEDRIEVLSEALVKAMKHEVFANYLKSAGLTPEESVAGHEEWTKNIREEYAQAV
ncbi:MAG: tripartite tricarboxylate transporter substrate binding protein, partial [Xanthomonadales bacterium]|nr:tripartite tricarboxylate transporter substrate binding protein [Xanthomonadales bacterium]